MQILCGIATAAATPLGLLAHHPGVGPRYADYVPLILPGLAAVAVTAMLLWRFIRRG